MVLACDHSVTRVDTDEHVPETMPRLLPRLLQRLQNVRSRQEQTVSALKRPQCGPPAPITYRPPPECPSLSPGGRTQSIILDSLNPILKLGKYKRHKFVPPSLRVRKRRRKTTSAERLHEYEESRAMTVEERSYWASPYCAHTFIHTMNMFSEN